MLAAAGVVSREGDIVPAHVRDGKVVGEADALAGEDSQTVGISLLSAFEQQLLTEADAEEWFIGGDEVLEGGFHTGRT